MGPTIDPVQLTLDEQLYADQYEEQETSNGDQSTESSETAEDEEE